MADPTNLSDQQFLSQDPEVLGLQRQRQLANLLTGQAFNAPQGQVISGHYVKPSALQQALPMINAAIGGMTNANLDTKQQELAAALRQKQSAQFDQYGQLEQVDKGKALRFALGSDNPVLRDIAKEELKGLKLGKGDIFTKTTLGGQNIKLEGNPDLPESIQYAISIGQLPPNPATWTAQQAQKAQQISEQKAKAGASHFNFTDILGKDIGQVKDLLTASQTRVQAGEMSSNAANKIEGAIKSGNLNVGPGALVGQYLGQIGDSLGLVNEKGQDKLVQTRAAVQGLAQMWAASRAQAKGQGAMDQKESELYGKISSGNIENLSMPELKYIVDQTKSQGNYFRQEHTRLLNELKKDEKLKNIVPFYDVGFMPSQTTNLGASGNSGGVKYLGPAN